MKRKIVFSGLVLVLVVGLLAGCGAGTTTTSPTADSGKSAPASAPAEKEPYKIGAVLSLSGDYAGLGGPEKNAMEMEVAKINAAGGVNGSPLELIIEDDGTDPNKAVTAVSKLINQDKVSVIIGASGTAQTMAMANDLKKNSIPCVSLASGTVVGEPVMKDVFQVAWPNRVVVPRLAEYLVGTKQTKIAFLASSDAFGEDGKKAVQAEFTKQGVELVYQDTFDPKGLDFKNQLTKAKDSGADALLIWGAGKAPAIIAKNRVELKMEMPLIVSHGSARKEFIEGAGAAAEGVIMPSGKIVVAASYGDTPAGKLANTFVSEYKAKYKEEPNGTFPGHGYDGVYIVKAALEKVGKAPAETSPSAIRDALETISGLELLGGKFSFSPTDHSGTNSGDLIMIQVKDGKFVQIEGDAGL